MVLCLSPIVTPPAYALTPSPCRNAEAALAAERAAARADLQQAEARMEQRLQEQVGGLCRWAGERALWSRVGWSWSGCFPVLLAATMTDNVLRIPSALQREQLGEEREREVERALAEKQASLDSLVRATAAATKEAGKMVRVRVVLSEVPCLAWYPHSCHQRGAASPRAQEAACFAWLVRLR